MGEKIMRNISGQMVILLVLVLAAALPALWLLTEAAFAEETTEDPVLLKVNVGDNGTVDGHENDYIEKIDSGEDVTLTLEADEGYVIDDVQINEEPLETSDLEGIAGESYAELDLDSLDSDLEVAVSFAEGEATVDAADDEGAADTSEDAETGESEGNVPAEGSEDPEAAEVGTGADEDGEDAGSEDADAEDDADEPGTEEDPEADDDADDEVDSDLAGTDESGKGSVAAGGSPRTGDSFPLTILLILAASLTMIGIVICRVLQNRRQEG